MKGLVFNIQKFCLHDGPGIRTTVFLKGCPLKCKWCHNPEGISKRPILAYFNSRCIMCGFCESICENKCHTIDNEKHSINREKCTGCGKCAHGCLDKALEISGEEITCYEVLEKVLEDKEYYETSGGGLTISGGEPLMQIDFVYELLKEAKKNKLNTCIETSGYGKTEDLYKVAPYVDLFLYDYKQYDDNKHKEYTGVSNKLIIKNLETLNELGAQIILRCPIIPGCNDTIDHFREIENIKNKYKNIKCVEIMPYHSLGEGKLERYGIESSTNMQFKVPEKEEVENWKRIIKVESIIK